MSVTASARAALVGAALSTIATGILLLLVKEPVIMPAVAWLRSLAASDLDSYLSMLARVSIGIGAITLLAVIVATYVPRGAARRESEPERE